MEFTLPILQIQILSAFVSFQDLNERALAAWEELGRRNKLLLRYVNTKLGPTVCASITELKRYFAAAQVKKDRNFRKTFS